jgi:hypothetical protein
MLPSLIGIIASSGGGVANSYESIATVTVGAGGASSVSFTSIPSTYTHLQIRAFGFTNRATFGVDGVKHRFNSDSGSNYAIHQIYGEGSTVFADGGGSQTSAGGSNLGTTVSSYPGSYVLDILDYANTNKYKTTRLLGGTDLNGTIAGVAGYLGLYSGLWLNTAAISTITITPNIGTAFTQYSSFALYGIKG